MSKEMDALKVQVTATDGVIQSAIIAFQGGAALVTDAADLTAQAAALAAAIPATP